MICDACGNTFKTNADLREHQKKVHVALQYPCPQCDKSFKSAKNQRLHILSIHTPETEKPFQCNFCTKVSFK